jgi:hypothetical protein
MSFLRTSKMLTVARYSLKIIGTGIAV